MVKVDALSCDTGGSGTLAFSHRAKKLLASSSLSPSWLRSSLHTPLTTVSHDNAPATAMHGNGAE